MQPIIPFDQIYSSSDDSSISIDIPSPPPSHPPLQSNQCADVTKMRVVCTPVIHTDEPNSIHEDSSSKPLYALMSLLLVSILVVSILALGGSADSIGMIAGAIGAFCSSVLLVVVIFWLLF